MISFVLEHDASDSSEPDNTLTQPEKDAILAAGQQTVWFYPDRDDKGQIIAPLTSLTQNPDLVLNPHANLTTRFQNRSSEQLPPSPDPDMTDISEYCVIQCNLFPQPIMAYILQQHAVAVTLRVDNANDIIVDDMTTGDYGVAKLGEPGRVLPSSGRLEFAVDNVMPWRLTAHAFAMMFMDSILFSRNKANPNADNFTPDFSKFTPEIINAIAPLAVPLGQAVATLTDEQVVAVCHDVKMTGDETCANRTTVSPQDYYRAVAAYCDNHPVVLAELGVTGDVSMEEAIAIAPIPQTAGV